VDEVVAADGQGVAVAGDDPDRQVGAGHGQAGGDGRGAAVDGVHAVGVEVVREAARAADPGHEHGVLAFDAQGGQELADGGEHGVVAAAGAPADLLVGGEVARGLLVGGGRDEIEPAHHGKAEIGAHARAPEETSVLVVGWDPVR
jgi:hypothetical protein